VNYDDETLMAYADGELDDLLNAEISAAIERDPALALRVQRHRALRDRVAGAYSIVLERPLPERLRAAASGPQRRAEVLQFPARTSAPGARRWGTREWAALAASLVLGMLLSWQFIAPSRGALVTAADGALVASGALARALDSQLASAQRPEDPVQIGLTFRSQDGSYCRSFTLKHAATAGLACRVSGEWRVPVTAAAAGFETGIRQASSLPPAVLSAIEARIDGDALDAAGEETARRGGWDAQRK
jgi:hypothetical protein